MSDAPTTPGDDSPRAELPERLEVAPDVVFREVAGEAVILDLSTECYYGLDEVGTRLWQLLAEEGELAVVRRRMLEEFEVGEEELDRDMAALVGDFLAEGLLRSAEG